MKRKKAHTEEGIAGTVLAGRMRRESNKLLDTERKKLGDEFLKLYYGGD